MKKEEILSKIEELSESLKQTNEDYSNYEMKAKIKNLEARKIKNEIESYKLQLQEISINEMKDNLKNGKKKVTPLRKKFCNYREKDNAINIDERMDNKDPYVEYIEKEIVPYND